MKKYLTKLLLLTLAVLWVCTVQASALEYSYAGADDFLFGRPTRSIAAMSSTSNLIPSPTR